MAKYKVSVTFEVESEDDRTDELHAAILAVASDFPHLAQKYKRKGGAITKAPIASVRWLDHAAKKGGR